MLCCAVRSAQLAGGVYIHDNNHVALCVACHDLHCTFSMRKMFVRHGLCHSTPHNGCIIAHYKNISSLAYTILIVSILSTEYEFDFE